MEIMELNHIKNQVEYTLQNYPETRNDDKKLQVKVLKGFYGVEKIEDILKPNIPSLESIRRCRQKLQSEGKYKSQGNIKEVRHEMEETYKQFAAAKD
jgi:hypothetical protein